VMTVITKTIRKSSSSEAGVFPAPSACILNTQALGTRTGSSRVHGLRAAVYVYHSLILAKPWGGYHYQSRFSHKETEAQRSWVPWQISRMQTRTLWLQSPHWNHSTVPWWRLPYWGLPYAWPSFHPYTNEWMMPHHILRTFL
jgi:hypothetical protein